MAAVTGAPSSGDEPSGCVRRRRRAQRQPEAGGVGRGRGIDGHRPGAPGAEGMTWPRASGVALAWTRAQATAAGPTIEWSLVPPVDEGGSERLGAIQGRVIGARPGQRIVLYAQSGDWYVQPFADRPQPDSTWRSSTHLGTEYAALLVDAEFRRHPLLREGTAMIRSQPDMELVAEASRGRRDSSGSASTGAMSRSWTST